MADHDRLEASYATPVRGGLVLPESSKAQGRDGDRDGIESKGARDGEPTRGPRADEVVRRGGGRPPKRPRNFRSRGSQDWVRDGAEREEDRAQVHGRRPPRPLRAPGQTGWNFRRPDETPKRKSAWDDDDIGANRRHHVGDRRDKSTRVGFFRDTPMTSRLPAMDDEEDLNAYVAEQERAERQWYLQDDNVSNLLLDDTAAYTATVAAPPVDEEDLARKQARRLSARAAALHADASRWEDHQMRLGGASGGETAEATELDESTGPRIGLLVKDTTPPFLDGRVSHTVQEATVLPIKDPTSDMAVVARKGSALVKTHRESKDKAAGRIKYWELGSKFAGAKAQSDAKESADRALSERQRSEMREKGDDHERETSEATSTMRYADALKTSSTPQSEFARSNPVEAQRRKLPVYSVRDELLQVIRDNTVVVIVGETGSGKTTQLTQYLREEMGKGGGLIGCTQPRRVAAVSVAQRVAEESQVKLGKQVGYAIRFEDQTCDETVIKYMTDGILLRETLSDPELDKYGCIIMDEAHERSLNTDVLFGVLRDILSRRRDLRVIVTSATLNAEKFSAFFGGAPIFNIPGRTFPVEVFFAKTPCEDYVEAAVRQVLQIHVQAPIPGDILVFMTGQEDIETTCEVLAERMSKLEEPSPLLILPIYSQLAADLQAKIFEPAPDGSRKVVVATNIAETSITVDGVRYVVDSGFCKLKTYNPRLGMDALLLCPTSRASANQRSGRAGRTGPGKCYRLYTAPAFANEMLESSVPEIQRTNLSHVVLLLKSIGVRNLLDFAFMDPPPADNIIKSMHSLWTLGALNGAGDLTDLGKRMSAFPLDPPLSAMVLAGERLGCAAEIVTIVSMLSIPSVFYRPRGREEESDAAREKFFVPESDHLTLLHVFQRWKATGCQPDWCNRHFINAKGMRRAREVRGQLLDVMKDLGVVVSSCGTDTDVVRRAICASYFTQAARMKGIGEYINMRTGVVCQIHPTSALYGLGFTPDYVVYHELIYTQKEYMSCVTAVEPEWLSEMGPMFYVLKEGGLSRLEKYRREKEDKRKLEAEMKAAIETQAAVAETEAVSGNTMAPRERLVTPGRRTAATPRRPARFGL